MIIKPLKNRRTRMLFEIELSDSDFKHSNEFGTKHFIGQYILEIGRHGEEYSDAIICEKETGVEVNFDDLNYDFCALVEEGEYNG